MISLDNKRKIVEIKKDIVHSCIYVYVRNRNVCMKHLFRKLMLYLIESRRWLKRGIPIGDYSRRTDRGDVHEVLAFGTVLSKLVSSQPPGAEAHIVDPLWFNRADVMYTRAHT